MEINVKVDKAFYRPQRACEMTRNAIAAMYPDAMITVDIHFGPCTVTVTDDDPEIIASVEQIYTSIATTRAYHSAPVSVDEIIEARSASGLTEAEASAIVYVSEGVWRQWESGNRTMHPAFLHLFTMQAL